jgi:hypothetical protein
MREIRTSGSVEGVLRDGHSYSDPKEIADEGPNPEEGEQPIRYSERLF